MLPEPNHRDVSPTARQIGGAIRDRRIACGLSQEALGFAAETHRTYIGALERGQKGITVDKLVLVANALGCSASDLLKDCGL